MLAKAGDEFTAFLASFPVYLCPVQISAFLNHSKLEAAQRQLDCAIRLLLEGEDPLAVHGLAYAAYCILRDLCGPSQRREVLRQLEKSRQLGKVPNYKHADKRPHAILKKHSDKHTYITLALAIRLWKERGPTRDCRDASLLRVARSV